MVKNEKTRVPIKEGLWTSPLTPGEKPQLIGCRCLSCGEVFFPRQQICTKCQHDGLEDINLSRRGKIYNFTVVMQRPPVWYKGPIPYAIGYVELPERVRVETQFTGDFEALKIGMEAEMVIEKLHDDEEGHEVMAYKFRPISVVKQAGGQYGERGSNSRYRHDQVREV